MPSKPTVVIRLDGRGAEGGVADHGERAVAAADPGLHLRGHVGLANGDHDDVGSDPFVRVVEERGRGASTGPDAAGTSVTRMPIFLTPASRVIPAGPASVLPMPFVST